MDSTESIIIVVPFSDKPPPISIKIGSDSFPICLSINQHITSRITLQIYIINDIRLHRY